MSDTRYRTETFFKFKYFICVCIVKYILSVHTVNAQKTQGQNCNSTTECTSNLNCMSGICDCVGDFYYNNSSSSCLQKLDHGAECQSSAECKPSNTVCTSYLPSSTNKCLCTGGFYWTNYISCISQNNLTITVTNITRETRTITFAWHGVSQRSDVKYSIRWNSSIKMGAANTRVTVAGLKPGTLYNLSVITSLPGDGNYPPITVEQPQSPLWTRPDSPGPVSDVRRGANSTYAITFIQSNGSVSHYTMNVSAGGSLIETQSSASTVMFFTKLHPATTYIYVLQSYNGNSENSDPTTGNFTTGPEAAPHDILNLTVYSVRDESTQQISLNIAWTPGDQTEPTDYYILVQEAAGLDSTEHNQSIGPLTVTGYSSTTYVKSDVLAYWNYTVSVWAQTDKGNSSHKSAQHRTVENYPGAVQNLNVTQDATIANIVTLTFECPEIRSRNGSIEQFMITQTLLDPQGQEDKRRDIYNQSASDGQSEACSSGYTVKARNIMVERNYSFSVVTVNNKYEGVVNSVSNFYVLPKVPHLVSPQEMFQVDALVKQQVGSATEFTKIHADVCSSCLTDVRWGTVVNVGILVCAKGANCTMPGRKKRSTTQLFTQIPSWGSAKLRDFKIEYRTTPNKWVPATDGNNKYHPFVVGDDTSCSLANATDYCNGPLPAGQEFYIGVIMCTTAGCSVYRETHVFATYAPEDDEPPVGAIVGGVLGGLALIAVIGVTVCLIRKAQSRREIRESIRKNADTQVTSSDRCTPKQTFSGHIEVAQLGENSRIYDEIGDYDYITEETVGPVRHSHSPGSLVNNVRSHRNIYEDMRDSTELQFPYENEVSVNHDQDYVGYEHYL